MSDMKLSTKVCIKCKLEKETSLFTKAKKGKEGLASYCKECKNEATRISRAKNKESYKASNLKSKMKNIEKEKQRVKNFNANNHGYANRKSKECRERNLEEYRRKARERARENYHKVKAANAKRLKEWVVHNRDKTRAYNAKCKADRKHRITGWLTEDDWLRIEQVYKEAERLTKETGIMHHVDHIIPLKGKLVSGLHHPDNLQVLTADENLRKNNKFDIDLRWEN